MCLITGQYERFVFAESVANQNTYALGGKLGETTDLIADFIPTKELAEWICKLLNAALNVDTTVYTDSTQRLLSEIRQLKNIVQTNAASAPVVAEKSPRAQRQHYHTRSLGLPDDIYLKMVESGMISVGKLARTNRDKLSYSFDQKQLDVISEHLLTFIRTKGIHLITYIHSSWGKL